MGHADVSTTMNIYAWANPEVTRTSLENLAKNMDVFQKRVLYLGDKTFDQKNLYDQFLTKKRRKIEQKWKEIDRST